MALVRRPQPLVRVVVMGKNVIVFLVSVAILIGCFAIAQVKAF
jgi:hypothetical protein